MTENFTTALTESGAFYFASSLALLNEGAVVQWGYNEPNSHRAADPGLRKTPFIILHSETSIFLINLCDCTFLPTQIS